MPHKSSTLLTTQSIFAVQGFVNSVLNAAGVIPQDANKALVIFDNLQTILDVDVNVTGMNNDVMVSNLQPQTLICIHPL